MDVESRIYYGIVVDGYEFGHGVISLINSNIFRSMGLTFQIARQHVSVMQWMFAGCQCGRKTYRC